MKKLILIFVFLVVVVSTLTAQRTKIDSIRISPQSPVESDTIKVIVFNTVCGNALENFDLQILEDTIEIKASYDTRIDDSCYNYVDTFTIGHLQYGNYVLIFHLTDMNFTFDRDTLLFNVERTNSVLPINDNNFTSLKIVSNPVADFFYFKNNDFEKIKKGQIKIFNSRGILENSYQINENYFLVSQFPRGIYFYCINTQAKEIYKGKFIKD